MGLYYAHKEEEMTCNDFCDSDEDEPMMQGEVIPNMAQAPEEFLMPEQQQNQNVTRHLEVE